MIKLSCVLIGDELLLVQCAELLLGHGHSIKAIVTSNVKVRDWAKNETIHVIDPQDDFVDALAEIDYDWLFSIANLRLIPEAVWRNARSGAVNFHDGPLPDFAGLNTPSWAILLDKPRHGVTWHSVNRGIDEGDIYASLSFDISDDETALTLNAKCFEAGMTTFASMLGDIEQSTLLPQPQDFSRRNYYGRGKRPTAAATLCFDRPANELSRLVRALDFGAGHVNTITTPKIRVGTDVFTVTRLQILDDVMPQEPGLVISVGAQGAAIGTVDKPVLVEGALFKEGRRINLTSVLHIGMKLPLLDEAEKDALSKAIEAVAPFEAYFHRAIAASIDIDLPEIMPLEPALASDIQTLSLALPTELEVRDAIALIGAFLARHSGKQEFDIAYRSDGLLDPFTRHPGYFAGSVPLRIKASNERLITDFIGDTARTADAAKKHRTYACDLVERYLGRQAPRLSCGISDIDAPANRKHIEGCVFTFVLEDRDAHLLYDRTRVTDQNAQDFAARFNMFSTAFAARSGQIGALPLMSETERHCVLNLWNRTERAYDRTVCMHELIERQVNFTPDAEAICFRGLSLTYRQMDERANRIAHALVARGVGPDVLVGLHLPRSLDLVVAALAIQKAGGAYVPLDPEFPADRLAYMIADSSAKVVLTQRDLASSPALKGSDVLCIEDPLAPNTPATRLSSGVGPGNLAYVIYTSGSTGNPKGVMVEHGNVVNFFAGMSDVIPRMSNEREVWLAVTSLSFDISVLELFWTLANGFKVVIHQSQAHDAKARKPRLTLAGQPLDFGLFYWGNDAGAGSDKYRLLLEGSKFADRNDFQSVWTPERHFHAFGGAYPNPAVTGAAVAAVTKNLSIRAGSCVLPLHHPARVAEEWAVIDNLSNGRVALAFASGWMPEDFVLRPENAPPHNKAALLRDIETVRALWRGESLDFNFGTGKAGVITQPRPIQKELPVWLTTAGNPESYREAARLGANVLTHLLGQTIDELAQKIRLYRETLVETGRNPADYTVTLMLHTLLGQDREEVRDRARGPMKDYLRSAAALIKQYAWAFPAFKKPQGVSQPMDIDLQSLSSEELDAILEFAFLRYFEDSGLFGTIDDTLTRIDQVLAAGVDDIACLIDFGMEEDIVLERLEPLAALVRTARGMPRDDTQAADGVAAEIRRHKVTHLQCTPSMARMFLMSEEDRAALGEIKHLFIGGEALHGALLAELARATTAKVMNMYGPTETTIWSSTFAARPTAGVVPLGHPIANTQLYVLDDSLQPVAPGMSGELYIGGDGVTRGYLNREALTKERFLTNPFEEGRLYRTGDLARFTADGVLQFIGRIDHQVKVRGYRIELGEIEARIGSFEGVSEAIVVMREDQVDDVRIVAYIRTVKDVAEDALRSHIAKSLPDYMIPAHFVTLDAFPLTPNAKIDRKKLPKPGTDRKVLASENFVAPADTTQQVIAEVFRRALGIERVGVLDSFFALGGHSLLAVQVHRELKASLAPDLTITDLFRFPTVASLADHIGGRGKASERLSEAAERATKRRVALGVRLDQARLRDTV